MDAERRVVSLAVLERTVETILAPAGAEGRLVASALIDAELLGYPEFGVRLLREVANGARLDHGREVVRTPVSVVLDAAGCFGPVAAAGAAYLALEVARSAGVGVVGLRAVGAIGRLAPYVALVAESGFFGLMVTHSPPLVAPHGGQSPVLGTNPIAYAAPTPAGAVVADFATSMITKAALDRARKTLAPLPAGSALDADGVPTTDAARVQALLPFDGVKGFLAALFVELFAGALLEARGHPAGRGLLMVAITPTALGAPGAIEQVAGLADAVRSAGGRMPGAAASARRAAARARGTLEVEASVVDLIAGLTHDGNQAAPS